ncbi:LptA/OstA family protein [Treponema lecithinolyticum]|nr:LptA/OstA family protein [Treponema lecithinolyticum]
MQRIQTLQLLQPLKALKTNSRYRRNFCLPRALLYSFVCALYVLFPFAARAETIRFSADSMSGSTAQDSEYTRLSGSAQVETTSLQLKAGTITLSGTDYRIISAEENVQGTYLESGFTFKCNSLRYDRKTKVTVLEGAVSMNDTENDVQLKAEYIEYSQDTETALIQINVEITQDDALCTSAFAVYRKKMQILELSGAPKVKQKDDTFQAQEIVFDLRSREITLDGKVRGSVSDTSDTKESGVKSENGTKTETETGTESELKTEKDVQKKGSTKNTNTTTNTKSGGKNNG